MGLICCKAPSDVEEEDEHDMSTINNDDVSMRDVLIRSITDLVHLPSSPPSLPPPSLPPPPYSPSDNSSGSISDPPLPSTLIFLNSSQSRKQGKLKPHYQAIFDRLKNRQDMCKFQGACYYCHGLNTAQYFIRNRLSLDHPFNHGPILELACYCNACGAFNYLNPTSGDDNDEEE